MADDAAPRRRRGPNVRITLADAELLDDLVRRISSQRQLIDGMVPTPVSRAGVVRRALRTLKREMDKQIGIRTEQADVSARHPVNGIDPNQQAA
jgi:hypothetical protein